jgi:hypothetical protein
MATTDMPRMKSDLSAFVGARSQSTRPGVELRFERYNADGSRRRKCVACGREYVPKSGTQKRCEECRKGRTQSGDHV